MSSVEWYTPSWITDRCRRVMGSIDLDPASCFVANKFVRADKYYTVHDDGLSNDWYGNVFLNPPYGKECKHFVNKAIDEYRKGAINQATIMLKAATDTVWFRPLFKYTMCFIHGRVSCYNSNGSLGTTATFPHVVVYLGDNVDMFAHEFSYVGSVMTKYKKEGK